MKKEKIIFPEFEEEPEYYENVGLLGIIVITIGILVLLVLIVKTLYQLCSRFANNQNNGNKNTNDRGDICLTVVETLKKNRNKIIHYRVRDSTIRSKSIDFESAYI